MWGYAAILRCSAAIVVLSLSVVACNSGRSSSAPTVFAAATIGADDARQLLAREAASWRETWLQPALLWDELRYGLVSASTTATQVAVPIGVPPLGGTIAASHFWKYDLPRTFAGQLFTDVARFDVTLAWNRHDLGTGQRQHTFWFAPGVGLLAMAIDGVVHERTAP